ncbi:hypothetical protein ACFL0H_12375 [Thermodesulfobacteriota bacterium]
MKLDIILSMYEYLVLHILDLCILLPDFRRYHTHALKFNSIVCYPANAVIGVVRVAENGLEFIKLSILSGFFISQNLCTPLDLEVRFSSLRIFLIWVTFRELIDVAIHMVRSSSAMGVQY